MAESRTKFTFRPFTLTPEEAALALANGRQFVLPTEESPCTADPSTTSHESRAHEESRAMIAKPEVFPSVTHLGECSRWPKPMVNEPTYTIDDALRELEKFLPQLESIHIMHTVASRWPLKPRTSFICYWGSGNGFSKFPGGKCEVESLADLVPTIKEMVRVDPRYCGRGIQ